MPSLEGTFVKSYEDISKNAHKKADDVDVELVLDARPAGR